MINQKYRDCMATVKLIVTSYEYKQQRLRNKPRESRLCDNFKEKDCVTSQRKDLLALRPRNQPLKRIYFYVLLSCCPQPARRKPQHKVQPNKYLSVLIQNKKVRFHLHANHLTWRVLPESFSKISPTGKE